MINFSDNPIFADLELRHLVKLAEQPLLFYLQHLGAQTQDMFKFMGYFFGLRGFGIRRIILRVSSISRTAWFNSGNSRAELMSLSAESMEPIFFRETFWKDL